MNVLPLNVTNAQGQRFTVTRVRRPFVMHRYGVLGIVSTDGIWRSLVGARR